MILCSIIVEGGRMRGDFSKKVYQVVRKIPKGRVMTYGQIARQLGKPQAARAVGNILHQNTSSEIPCHRVVNKKGKIALRFAFGGGKEQKRKLLIEGIKFKDKIHVDLEKSLISDN